MNRVKRIQDWLEQSPMKKLREARGVTVEQMASAMGKSIQLVRNWEKNIGFPTERDWRGIHSILGHGLKKEYDNWVEEKPKL